MVHLLDLTPEGLKPDPVVLGPLLENFVALELLKQRAWSHTCPEIFHFRDHAGTEVDFILAAPGGKSLVGIEVKASATIGPSDTKGLKVLSAGLKGGGSQGVILYLGDEIIPLARDIHALPLSTLWQLGLSWAIFNLVSGRLRFRVRLDRQILRRVVFHIFQILFALDKGYFLTGL